MDSIKVHCPDCPQRYRVPASAIGRRITCKHCGASFLAVDPDAPAAPATAEPASAAATAAGDATEQPTTSRRRSTDGRPTTRYVHAPKTEKSLHPLIFVGIGTLALLLLLGGYYALTAQRAAPAGDEPVVRAPPPPAPTPAPVAQPDPQPRIETVSELPVTPDPEPEPEPEAMVVADPEPEPEPVLAHTETAVIPPPAPRPTVAVKPIATAAVDFDPAWIRPRNPAPWVPEDKKPTRFHQYTKKYFDNPGQAGVQQAGYLGGPGSEWLAGAGFQPDGSLVLAGTCLGPQFTLAGRAPDTVLGQDGPAPPAPKPIVKTKKGKTTEYPADWTDANRTGFVARLSPDGQTITSLTRFAWQSGAITDCLTDADGAIYVAGQTGSAFAALGASEDVSAPDDQSKTGRVAWVAKLTPTADQIVWLRTFADAHKGVSLRRDAQGNIQAEGGWVYLFSAEGAVQDIFKVRKADNWVRGINPLDGSFVLGYDRNTNTGREPWRQPHLEFRGPQDEEVDEYYVWNPKLVGTDQYRLVSDSTFRYFHFNNEGLLYAVGWSDGGNTVFERQPKDLDTNIAESGLGFSSWGAGALSNCHIMRIDQPNDRVLSKTIWMGYLTSRESPSSANIDALHEATDGSVVFAGGSAAGLIQTGNNFLVEGMSGGPYVAVLNKNMDNIRFSSSLTGISKLDLATDTNWRFASAIVGDRHKVIAVGHGIAEKGAYVDARPAPSWRPVQEGYGGGLSDGWFLMLDLGPVR